MTWELYIICKCCGGEAVRVRTTRKEFDLALGRAAQHQIFVCEKCGKRTSETVRRKIKRRQSAQPGQL